MTKPYPQCGNDGRLCKIPDCGPPWCLPDGEYTTSREFAEQVARGLRIQQDYDREQHFKKLDEEEH